MDGEQCPGCGAAVRPRDAWCSLCFHQLRPADLQVNEPAEPSEDPQPGPSVHLRPDLIKMNLIEAGRFETNVIEVPELRSVVPRPADSPADEAVDAGEPAKTWPCTCGEAVLLDLSACPTCGRAFLEELRGLDDLNKGGPQWLSSYLAASRGMRLTIATFVAVALAFAVTGLLLLFS